MAGVIVFVCCEFPQFRWKCYSLIELKDAKCVSKGKKKLRESLMEGKVKKKRDCLKSEGYEG